MATVTKENCYHGTLTAATVDTVNIISPWPTVTVVNRSGSAEIYFTVNGTAPTVGGDDTFVLPAVIGSVTVITPAQAGIPATGNPSVVVKLISSGTPTYSVENI